MYCVVVFISNFIVYCLLHVFYCVLMYCIQLESIQTRVPVLLNQVELKSWRVKELKNGRITIYILHNQKIEGVCFLSSSSLKLLFWIFPLSLFLRLTSLPTKVSVGSLALFLVHVLNEHVLSFCKYCVFCSKYFF